MAPIVPSLPLTSVAQSELQQELVNILKSNWSDWSDVQASNSMIMLLEVLSAIQELDYAYINRMAREAFIQYALDYRNVVAHAKALGYQPAYQTPSSVQAVITSASSVTAATTIPAGTQFQSNLSGVVYQTEADVIIPQNTRVSPELTLKQQVTCVEAYTGTGDPNQQVPFNQKPVIPTSVTVTVNGASWTAVDNFVDSISTDLVYTWSMDLLGNYTILFGDGINGSTVPSGATVRFQYNIGGGSKTAIGANGLGTCISDVSDAGNNTLLSLSAYNAIAAVPGGDAETTAQIRSRAPINLQSPRCLMTKDDIQNAVNALPGVFSSRAVNWQDQPWLPRYQVELFVVPVGFSAPSESLIDTINDLFAVKPLVLGQSAVVTGATYLSVNFNMQVFIKSGYNQNSVQNAVAALLTQLFQNLDPNQYNGFVVGFGVPIFMSVITALIQQIPGVRNVIMLAPGDTILTVDQFPILGNITFVPTP